MSNNSKNIGEKVWHEKTRLGEDNCYNDSRVNNSKKPGDYNLQTNIKWYFLSTSYLNCYEEMRQRVLMV